jgi:hypothetical protein
LKNQLGIGVANGISQSIDARISVYTYIDPGFAPRSQGFTPFDALTEGIIPISRRR